MQLRELEIENIRSFESALVQFQDGITLLSGDIGAGKTTLLQCIEFAFFGTIRTDLDGQALLRVNTTQARVRLSFILNNHQYSIERGLQKTKQGVAQTNCLFIKDGVEHKLTPTQLRAKILELFGYPTYITQKNLLYRYTTYTSQDSMKSILFEKTDVRQETLRILFGIETYKTVKSNVQIGARALREQMMFLSGELSLFVDVDEQISSQKQTMNELESQKQKIIQKKQEAQKKEHEIAQELQLEKELLQTLEKQRQEEEFFKKQLQEKKVSLEQLQTTIEHQIAKKQEFEQLQKPEHLVDELYEKNSLLESKKSQIILQKQQVQEKRSRLQEHKQQLLDQLAKKEQQKQLENKKQELQKITEQKIQDSKLTETALENLKQTFHQKKAQLETINEIFSLREKDSCPTCFQPITKNHIHAIQTKNTQTKETLIDQINTLTQSMQRLESKLKEQKQLEHKQELAKQELVHINQRLNDFPDFTKLHQDVEQTDKDISQLHTKIYDQQLNQLQETLEKNKKQIQLSKEYEQKKQEYTTLINILQEKHELKKTTQQMIEQLKANHIPFDHENFKKQTQKVQEREKQQQLYKQTLHEQEIELQKNTVQLSQAKIAFEKLQEQKQKQQTIEKKKRRLEKKQRWIKEFFIPLLEQLEIHTFQEVHAQCSSLFSHWFDMLIEDDSIQGYLDEQFSPVISQNGHAIPVEYLSGGEKTSVALAYRLALNTVLHMSHSQLQTQSLLILDEPTDGFSSQQLDRIRDVLKELHAKQILIVSHEQKVETFVEHIIHVQKKDTVSVIE
ncbi:MAG: hypothetical protein ACMXYF_04450 [Candidatus Woesearchaeota archaeon]